MPDFQRPYAVVDLDGVLADVRHRLHHVQSRPKQWDAFFAAAVEDPVLPEGLAVLTRLAETHEVVYLTGRPEKYRRDTLAWLRRVGAPEARLIMRREDDRRPARVVKVELLRRLAGQRPVDVLVDDDDLVVAAAREAGFTVLHADWMPAAEPAGQQILFDAQEREGRS